jgi:hypothetical protein
MPEPEEETADTWALPFERRKSARGFVIAVLVVTQN